MEIYGPFPFAAADKDVAIVPVPADLRWTLALVHLVRMHVLALDEEAIRFILS